MLLNTPYITTYKLTLFPAFPPSGRGLAGTRRSPFWIVLELIMMEVVVTTEAIRRAKLQSNHHHQQNRQPAFLHDGCTTCPGDFPIP